MKAIGFVIAAVIAASAWWAFASGRPVPRRDGHWRATMRAQLPGVTAQPPTMQFTHCVTKEDAADPAKLVPLDGPSEMPGLQCKVVAQRLEGATVSWETDCPGADAPMSGKGRFTYTADAYHGTVTLTVTKDGEPVTMTMSYEGERLDDCHKSMPMTPVPVR